MGEIKKLIIMLIMGFCAVNVFAKQITFQIVQHDSSASDVTEQSLVIEDEILNNFFEYGFIVTNSPAKISGSDAMDEKLFKNGVGEAFNGYSDYFVQITLFYTRNEETKTKNSDLNKINFSVANAKTGTKFAEKVMDDIKLEHKKDDLKKVSSVLVNEINKAIKANKA